MRIYITLLLFALTTMVVAQAPTVNENFIRIVGNAERMMKANNIELEIQINDIPPNEYKQVRYKSIDEVRKEFMAELASAGIPQNAILLDKHKNITKKKYNKTLNEYYTVSVSTEDDAYKVSQLAVDGCSVQKVNYKYETLDEDVDVELALAAIEDAKRKAESIAKAVNRKVGRIINIEDKPGKIAGSNSYGASATKNERKYSYTINVAFELL